MVVDDSVSRRQRIRRRVPQGLAGQRLLSERAAASLPGRPRAQPADVRPQRHPVAPAYRRLAARRARARGHRCWPRLLRSSATAARCTVAAELARLAETTAVRNAARLEVASILEHGDPVEFLHPLLRAAVEAELPDVVLGELHARAARLLWLVRRAAGSVAQHLVNSPGSGDAGCRRSWQSRVAPHSRLALWPSPPSCSIALSKSPPRPSRRASLLGPRAGRARAGAARRRPRPPRGSDGSDDREVAADRGRRAFRRTQRRRPVRRAGSVPPAGASSSRRRVTRRPRCDCAPSCSSTSSWPSSLVSDCPRPGGDRCQRPLGGARHRPVPAGDRGDLRAHHAARYDAASGRQPASSGGGPGGHARRDALRVGCPSRDRGLDVRSPTTSSPRRTRSSSAWHRRSLGSAARPRRCSRSSSIAGS